MATPIPITPKPTLPSGDQLTYSAQFKEDDSTKDMSAYDDIEVTLYNQNGTVFTQKESDGDISISSSTGSAHDIISGVVSGDVTSVGARNYYLKIIGYTGTGEDAEPETLVFTDFQINNKPSNGYTSFSWLITISNTTDEATGETATNILALAVEAKNEAQGYAANLNRADIQSGDAGKIERIKSDESGWEIVEPSEAGIATETYVDDKASLLRDKANQRYFSAHRGYSHFAPENTIPAITGAIDRFDSIELDILFSSDDEAVCIHDTTVDRTTNGTGNVADKTLAELKALDAGSWLDSRWTGTEIPTLEEALKACRGKFDDIIIEIKQSLTATQAQSIVTTVQGLNMDYDVRFMSLSSSWITPILSIYDAPVGIFSNNGDISAITNDDIPFLANYNDALIGITYADLIANPSLVQAARNNGINVLGYTINDWYKVVDLQGIGVTKILTDKGFTND